MDLLADEQLEISKGRLNRDFFVFAFVQRFNFLFIIACTLSVTVHLKLRFLMGFYSGWYFIVMLRYRCNCNVNFHNLHIIHNTLQHTLFPSFTNILVFIISIARYLLYNRYPVVM